MTEPKDQISEVHRILATPNPDFEAWVASMDQKLWARFDLSAARLGWEAALTTERERSARLREALEHPCEPAVITAANQARLGITTITVRSIVRDYLSALPIRAALCELKGGEKP